MKNWFAGLLAAVIAGVLVFWLTEGLRNNSTGNNQPVLPNVSPAVKQATTYDVKCSANPVTIKSGYRTMLVVQTITTDNRPLGQVNIRIDSGGGRFVTSGSQTALGYSDGHGFFRVNWESPSPAARAYVFSVQTSKPGYQSLNRAECKVWIN